MSYKRKIADDQVSLKAPSKTEETPSNLLDDEEPSYPDAAGGKTGETPSNYANLLEDEVFSYPDIARELDDKPEEKGVEPTAPRASPPNPSVGPAFLRSTTGLLRPIPEPEKLACFLQSLGASAEFAKKAAPAVCEFLAGQQSGDVAKLTLPPNAPKSYVPRGAEKPVQFLNDVWAPWLEAGALHQHTLRKLDPLLMKALENHFGKDRAGLASLIPTKSAEVTKRLEALAGHPLGLDERDAVATAERFLRKAKRDKGKSYE